MRSNSDSERSRSVSVYSSQGSNSEENQIQKAIKASLEEVNTNEKIDKNLIIMKNEQKEEKLTREMDFCFNNFNKNDFLITPQGIGKIVKEIQEDTNNKIGKTNIKYEIDGKTQTTNLENLNFTLHKLIKVFVINYQDRIFQINFPININDDFEYFKHSFCIAYNLNEKSVAIIYKNNKLGKKDLKRKFGKDFDYNNDYVTILQAKAKPVLNIFELYPINARIKENETKKFIFMVNIKATCQYLYLFKAPYSGYKCVYNNFQFRKVNNIDIQSFKTSDKEEQSKKKKESKKVESQYNFDKILKNSDNYDFETYKTVDYINADNNGNNSDEDSDSENSIASKDKKKRINSKTIEVDIDNIVLFPDTVYIVNFSINSSGYNVGCLNLKSDKVKKYIKDGFETTFYLQDSSSSENINAKNCMFFAGIGYTIKTIFDDEE